MERVCFTMENKASIASSSRAHFSATGIRTGRICSTTGRRGWTREDALTPRVVSEEFEG